MEQREPKIWLQWPAHPSLVKKGDDFEPEAMGLFDAPPMDLLRRKSKSLAMLKAAHVIDGWISSDQNGRKWSICIRGDMVHVNTDSEALIYHNWQAGLGIDKLSRHTAALSHRVDAGNLSADDLARLHRQRAIRAMQAEALRSVALPKPQKDDSKD